MIAFDLAYELTLGAVCAGHGGARGLRNGLLASTLVYVPSATAGLLGWPGWQGMYLLPLEGDALRLGLASLAQAVALLGCFLLGTRIGLRRPLLWALGWAGVLAFLFGALWKRAFFVTTWADFHSARSFELAWGEPDSMLGGPVMGFLLVTGALNLAALGLVLRANATAGPRARPTQR